MSHILCEHDSDSKVQRDAECLMRAWLNVKLAAQLVPLSRNLPQGCTVQIDGCDTEKLIICEMYARIGHLKSAQRHKVASDILKINLICDKLGGQWKKYICFASENAAQCLEGNSWLATVARHYSIEGIVADLGDSTLRNLEVAQMRQRIGAAL